MVAKPPSMPRWSKAAPWRGGAGPRGVTMLEVMVTVAILSFGLIGLAKLQVNLQVTEMESYQRAQALLLVKDMGNRLAINRALASAYVTTSALGSGMTCPSTTGTSTLAQVDLAEWCQALQGAAELDDTNKMGSVIGGRGCIEQLTNPNEYMVTVAWQGMVPLVAPASSLSCGSGQYRTSNGGACDGSELCRRTVTTVIRIDSLS